MSIIYRVTYLFKIPKPSTYLLNYRLAIAELIMQADCHCLNGEDLLMLLTHQPKNGVITERYLVRSYSAYATSTGLLLSYVDLNLAFGVLVETKKFYATPSPLRAEKSLHSSTTCLTSEAYSILGIPIQYSDPQSRSTRISPAIIKKPILYIQIMREPTVPLKLVSTGSGLRKSDILAVFNLHVLSI